MNHDEHQQDSTLARELRDSLSELAVPGPPPLAAIARKGRVHRRRRRLAGLSVTSAAACIALALGLTGVFGADPARSTGTIQTSEFTLTSFSNGTVALRLGQLFDPAAFQRALAHYHIPALVETGTYCSSNPAAPGLFRAGVVGPPAGPAKGGHPAPPGAVAQSILQSANFPMKPSQLAPMVDPISVVLNPAAIPAGTELFIGFYDLGHTVFVDLIYTNSHTCARAQDPPGVPWAH
jgi:hypothetical protein